MANKATTEIKLTDEQIDRIVIHSEYVFCSGEDPANALPKVEDQEGWVDVLIPFTGLYYTGWTDTLDREQEWFEENHRETLRMEEELKNDDWKLSVDEKRRIQLTLEDNKKQRQEYRIPELIQSKGWRNFLNNLQEEDIPDYVSGKKSYTFWIPCSMEGCYKANFYAMLAALEHTILKGQVDNPKDWKFETCHHPREYNFTTDKIDYWVRKDVFALMCRPEVFESKWFKAYAKWKSTSCSGYTALYKYDEYFDPDNWWCREGVLLFWVALGLYSKENFLAPVQLKDVDTLEDKNIFDEEHGFFDIAGKLQDIGMEDWNPEWDLKEAY